MIKPVSLALSSTLALMLTLAACGGKKEDPPPPRPPAGAANEDELSIPLGRARALESSMLPSSVVFEYAAATGPTSAVLVGSTETEHVVLVTDDAGKSFRALKEAKKPWAAFAVAADGGVVMASATRGEPPKNAKTPQLFAPTDVRFTDDNKTTFESALPLVDSGAGAPTANANAKATAAPANFARAAVAHLGAKKAAFAFEDDRRRAAVRWAGSGNESLPPVALPAGERLVPVAYGQPPALLTVRGSALLRRPMPAPGEKLAAPLPIPGVVVTPAAEAELAKPPCPAGPLGARILPQPGNKTVAVFASADKASSFVLPARPKYEPDIGCGAGALLAHHVEGPGYVPTLCDLDGKCKTSTTPALRTWPGAHEFKAWSVATPKGGALAYARSSAEKWEVSLAISLDKLKTYDLPRVLGEGSTQRGRLELGALLSFEQRLVLLISADVTGTNRRSYYVIMSEDGGLTWAPP